MSYLSPARVANVSVAAVFTASPAPVAVLWLAIATAAAAAAAAAAGGSRGGAAAAAAATAAVTAAAAAAAALRCQMRWCEL